MSAEPVSFPDPLAITASDPRQAPDVDWGPIDRFFASRVKDPRDLHYVRRAVWMSLSVVPAGLAMFLLPWWLVLAIAPVYWGLVFLQCMGRYILLLHATSHRPLFKKEHEIWNRWIPILLAPFYGQTPYSYYVHHIGMHHVEDNLEYDLSQTMNYRRDSFVHWLHYAGTFWFVGLPLLAHYFWKNGKRKMLGTLLATETISYSLIAIGMYFAPIPTFVTFLFPLMLIRVLMMCGNWAQHAFVDPAAPDNNWKSAICLVNTRYNHKCYNDGYHIVHHLAPGLHWTEMPGWFEKRIVEAAENDAIIFDMGGKGSFQEIWRFLMRKDFDSLAERLVRLPGRERTHAEAVEFLKSRMVPIERPKEVWGQRVTTQKRKKTPASAPAA